MAERKRYVVDKVTHGWWVVREVLDEYGGYTLKRATRLAHQRNGARMRSKVYASEMAQRELDEAQATWPVTPEIHRLKAKGRGDG